MTRVQRLPWWKCQLGCERGLVFAWRGRVRCVCQMSRQERQQLSYELKLDLEDDNVVDQTD